MCLNVFLSIIKLKKIWPHCGACGNLSFPTTDWTHAVEVQSFNHWISREVPYLLFWNMWLFLLPLVFNTYYTLEDKAIFIHQWPFIRIRIGFGNIFEIDNKPVEKNKNTKHATLSNEKLVIGYYHYSSDNGKKEKRYVEISPIDADLFLIKMGGHFKRARDIATKLEEEHKQRNEE